MTAAEVLIRLVEAGVAVWVEGDRLRYRAPAGALDAELRGRAGRARAGVIALVRAGAVLPVERAAGSAEVRHDFQERAGMLEFEAGMARPAAEREAERPRRARSRLYLSLCACREPRCRRCRNRHLGERPAPASVRMSGLPPGNGLGGGVGAGRSMLSDCLVRTVSVIVSAVIQLGAAATVELPALPAAFRGCGSRLRPRH